MTTEHAAGAAHNLFSDVAPGWQRWDADLIAASRASSDALLAAVGIAPGMRALDIACGTGEPALRIAALVGPRGHVTAADAMPAMLTTAEEKARRDGLNNMAFQVADAADLPFPPDSFDAITCRMGVMFFQRERALAELRRVLRPGGRIGFVVWGPFASNPWLAAIRMPVAERSGAPLAPSAPDPCCYGVAGTLAAALRAAGFQDVREEPRRLIWSFAGTPERFWQFQADLGGALSLPGWETLTAEQQAAAKADSVRRLQPYQHEGYLDIPVAVNVATAIH